VNSLYTQQARRHSTGWECLLAAAATLATVGSMVFIGSASANAPLRVCATCAYTNIPDALAAAHSGDTLQISEGSYPEVITIASNVTLRGDGADRTTIGRVVVEAGVSATMTGVTITGVPHGPIDVTSGIRNAGSLTLRNSVVSRNVAITNDGGGILNTGVLTVQNSSVHGNVAPLGNGGGICNRGTLILTNSRVTDNDAEFDGGGIINEDSLTMRGSTLARNFTHGGGGLANESTGVSTLSDSAISDNGAIVFGGGVLNRGALALRNSVISGNAAPVGPGIYNDGGTVTLRDSTVQP